MDIRQSSSSTDLESISHNDGGDNVMFVTWT